MIDFSFTENQLAVRDMARTVAQKIIIPSIAEYDRKQEMITALLPAMAEANLLGFCIPEAYGGLGMDYISLGLASEEMEYGDTSARVVLSVHIGLFSLPLLTYGSEEQKQKYLVPAAKGEKISTFGLTEPAAGSDVVGLQTTAVKDGDSYILNGEKMWISLATKSDNALVVMRTDTAAKDPHEGLTAFIVEMDTKGVTTGDIHGKLGVRAGSTGWIAFQDVRVPEFNRLGEEGEGFKIAMSCLDNGRYTVAAGATGLIRASLDASVNYAHQREAFGREIGKFQLVQQKIAHMVQSYEMARLLYLRAGWMKNQGTRNTRETSIAKWFATDASFSAASEAIQVHGAYGYSDEYDVERYLRNSKGAVIYEGTSEVHQLMQAGYALGYRKDGPLRKELPAYDAEFWQEE